MLFDPCSLPAAPPLFLPLVKPRPESNPLGIVQGVTQMQEVRGSNPRLGGLWVSQLQASGGISTLQSRASGLQSTTQGNSIRTKNNPSSQKTNK